MFDFEIDAIREIYNSQMKELERKNFFDNEYTKRVNYLENCIKEVKSTLTPEQNPSFERLLGAIQIYNEYIQTKRFGNGKKYMYDLGVCLKNKY